MGRRTMRRRVAGILAAMCAAVLLSGCGDSADDVVNGPTRVDEDGETGTVVIVDRTGKEWDVTHAQETYSMEADSFQFGLGPDAIPPINGPRFLERGDAGFPADDEGFLVLATEIDGDARAYRISEMSRREVANDRFGEAHVSPAY